MPPATKSCPKCGTVLAMPDPLPERVGCPKCKAVLKIRDPKPPGSVPAVALPPSRASAPHPQQQAQAVASPPLPMMAVAGHTLLRELARGGLGVVYLAHHDMLRDYRAIKRPLSDGGFDRDVLLARFRREVEAVGALRHEHIVRTFDAGIDAHGPYLVMEHLDGMSLASLAASHRTLPTGEACELVRQAALGLQGAYEAGLVHRDIKPSNLMLVRTRNGARVVIIDWGLVKRAGEAAPSAPAGGLTGSGIGLGTPDFMAPEQVADARTVDIRTDIYSLGVTLYSLLSGQVPYPDRSPLEKMLAHQKGEPFVPLEQLRPDVPQRLLAVIKKMMARDPGQRFETPVAVADALAFFATGANSGQLAALLGPETQRPIPPPSGSNTWGIPVSMEETSTTTAPPLMKDRKLLDSKTEVAPVPLSPVPLSPVPPVKRAGGIPRAMLAASAAVVLLLAIFGGVWMMRGDGKPKETNADHAKVTKTKDEETKDKETKDEVTKDEVTKASFESEGLSFVADKALRNGKKVEFTFHVTNTLEEEKTLVFTGIEVLDDDGKKTAQSNKGGAKEPKGKGKKGGGRRQRDWIGGEELFRETFDHGVRKKIPFEVENMPKESKTATFTILAMKVDGVYFRPFARITFKAVPIK